MINSIVLGNNYSLTIDENPAEVKHHKVEIMKEVMNVAKSNAEEDHKKMLEEISEFLSVLNDEYQKDIDNTQQRFKELDELNDLGKLFFNIAEFNELADMYKIDLENELEAIKNDFDMKKENGIKNIKRKYKSNNTVSRISSFI